MPPQSTFLKAGNSRGAAFETMLWSLKACCCSTCSSSCPWRSHSPHRFPQAVLCVLWQTLANSNNKPALTCTLSPRKGQHAPPEGITHAILQSPFWEKAVADKACLPAQQQLLELWGPKHSMRQWPVLSPAFLSGNIWHLVPNRGTHKLVLTFLP